MRPRRPKPDPKRSAAYNRLTRIVDGAVADALNMHPDYLTPRGAQYARGSIVKRVVGTLASFAGVPVEGRQVKPRRLTPK